MSAEARARVSAFIGSALGHANNDPDRPVKLGILIKPGQDTAQGGVVARDVETGEEFHVEIKFRPRWTTPVEPPEAPEQDLSVEIPPTAGRGGW